MAETEDYFGRYVGRLLLEPLSDGRLMRLAEPFGFEDRNSKRWTVPDGAKVDGASIPRSLWSLVGGPFEGKYRNASVIHDFYCDTRIEPWRAVHKVFFDAMRVSGVSSNRAKVMYAAVYFAGPRWSDTAVDNANLPKANDDMILYRKHHSAFELGVFDAVVVEGETAHEYLRSGKVMWPESNETRLDLNQIQKMIESENPTLAEIETAIDQASGVLEPSWSAYKRERTLIDLTKSLLE